MNNTYQCQCGKTLEEGKGHAKNDQCPEDWKISYNCGFCGETFDTFIVAPNFPVNTYKFLIDKILCEACEEKAYYHLLKENESLN